MKFKFLTLIIGCICMCCLPFIQRPVCAENSVNSVVNDTTVKSGSEKQSKGQDKKDEKKQEEKDKNEKNKTIWQKFIAGVRKIKKELIIGTVGALCCGLGFLGVAAFCMDGPSNFEDIPPKGKFTFRSAEVLLVGGALTSIGCLISAGVKLLM